MILLLACMALPATAQLDTSGLWINIDSIQITATRIHKDWLRSTRAVSEINIPDQATTPQLSLKEALQEVPGVLAMNAMNSAQDLRVSVRGFGSRAAFGVRGVKLIVDGIPETTTDGQGQMDGIPLSLIKKVELLKGPSSLLHGNASGGVIQMKTLSTDNHNFLAGPLTEFRILTGSFKTLQVQATAARSFGSTTGIGHISYVTTDGYRAQSRNKQLTAQAKVEHNFSKFSKIKFVATGIFSPLAEDAGGLRLADVATDRRAARTANVAYNTRESVNQLKLGTTYAFQVDDHKTFDTYAFYLNRSFEGFLPFDRGSNSILQRNFFGQGASYTVFRGTGNTKQTFKYGYDVSTQLDDRIRIDVDTLPSTPDLTSTDQKETYKNIGAYAMLELNFGSLLVNGGIRFDHNTIRLQDDYSFDGDASGQKDYSVFNPSVGFNYELPGGAAVFGSFSTGFDTPLLSELSNNPNQTVGFNFDLRPQSSRNLELGTKLSFDERVRAQLDVFQINTTDELIPYELASSPGRRFFRNVGSTQRWGIEGELKYNLAEGIAAKLSYTYSAFKFDEYERNGTDFSGNHLAGIPEHRLFMNLNYQHESGINASLDVHYVGELYTADDNAVTDPGYVLSDLRLSYDLKMDKYKLRPFLVVNNLLNTEYNDNIRINAFGKRYYEPGPGLHFYGGFSFRL